MITFRPAGTACGKSAPSTVSLCALLVGVLLLSVPFRVCLATTVPPGSAADSGTMPPSAVLPQLHGGYTLPRSADPASGGMVESGAFRERRAGAFLAGEQQPGAGQAEADARLFLFVLLGFAAIAAWLAEAPGRKD